MYIIYVNHDSCNRINLSIKGQRLFDQRNMAQLEGILNLRCSLASSLLSLLEATYWRGGAYLVGGAFLFLSITSECGQYIMRSIRHCNSIAYNNSSYRHTVEPPLSNHPKCQVEVDA